MRYLISTFLFFSLTVNADIIDDYRQNKAVVVVYGEKAPEAEKKAAQEIYEILELDSMDTLYDHIITDTYALKHKFFYSKFHLIIVGTPKTNILFANNSEIQVSTPEKNNSPLKVVPKLNLNKDSFVSAHYGVYPQNKGIGYVRRMLNPFTLQTFNLTEGKFNAGPYIATYIGGTDSNGVIDAYVQFLDLKMMEGITVPEEYLSKNNSRYKLSRSNLKDDFLDKLNEDFKINLGQEVLEYKGWIMGANADYAGMKKLTGISPTLIAQLKFASKPQLMTYDDQANSVLMVEFASAEESLKALKSFDEKMKLSLKIKNTADLTLYSCSSGQRLWYLVRKGKTIFIENFIEQWKEPFTIHASKLFKN